MEIRIVIIGDDNKVHPYEFPTYGDAINFLESKQLGATPIEEVKTEAAPKEDIIEDTPEGKPKSLREKIFGGDD